MSWKVVVWCHDCMNQDPYGCFDGESSTYDERFSTQAEAEAFAEARRRDHGSPWQYDVETDDRSQENNGL